MRQMYKFCLFPLCLQLTAAHYTRSEDQQTASNIKTSSISNGISDSTSLHRDLLRLGGAYQGTPRLRLDGTSPLPSCDLPSKLSAHL